MTRKFAIAVLTVAATLAASHGVAFGAAPDTAWADSDESNKINGSIEVPPGQHRGDLSTINGSIHVGSDAVVGQVKTVNGSVKVESRATSKTLTTVNGSITANDGVHVQGNLTAVSGALQVSNAADISGDVTNVSGGIHVESAHVGGNVDTCAGRIDLGPNAHIDGNVIVEKDNSWHFGFTNMPPPVHVVIGPGTVVKGTLHFERPVKLYVSDHATIGTVQGAEVIKFSGDHPPE
jgi:cytoskeletal protein CcmA (bactofilin family)